MKNRIFMLVPQVFSIADKLGIYSDDQTNMIEEYFRTEMKMVATMEGESKDSLEAAAIQIKEESFDAIGRLAGFNLVYHLTGNNRLDIDQEGAESAQPGELGGSSEAVDPGTNGVIEEIENVSGTNCDVYLDEDFVSTGNAENADKVYNALIEAGYSREAAAAIMGNLDWEHQFSAEMDGDQGSGGIAQWRGKRREDLYEYANKQGKEVTDIDLQIDYLINEDMYTRLGEDGVEELKNMTDFVSATDYVCHYFESPARYTSEEEWANSKYGPDYAQHGGTYKIKWEHFVWSDETQYYELHLQERRDRANYWYKTL